MSSLPSRQKIVQSPKYKANRRQTPEFRGTFPEECIVPQNTPRENGYERPESVLWRKFPILKSNSTSNIENHARPSSQTGVQGGCGRLSVTPNMKFEKIPAEKRLPPIATIQDWRELSPELLKRDAAWNVLCKHCPGIGSHSRREYFQRVIKWRKGIVDENEKRKCLICKIQKATTKPIKVDQNAYNNYDRVVSRLAYSHDYYNKFTKNGERKQEEDTSSNIQLSKKKDLQKKCKISTTPTPSPLRGSPLTRNPSSEHRPIQSVNTPDMEYSVAKVARYLQLYLPNKKGIHSKCRPLNKIFEPAYQSLLGPLKIVYKRKGLPGTLQKKTKSQHPDVQNDKLYQQFECAVGNLGLVYNLPDNNPNLGKRHVSIPRNTNFTRSREMNKKIDRTASTPVFPAIPRLMKPLKNM